MKITILTLFPKMLESFLGESIVKRAIDTELVEIEIVNLRDFSNNDYGSVDDRPYGGGAGMILRVDCLKNAIEKLKIENLKLKIQQRVILTSAKGTPYTQTKAIEFSKLDHLLLVAGHYEGVDERVLDYIDEEISLGDFVMTGGEIAAAAIIDSITRLLPGVLKKEDATEEESFYEVSLDRLMDVVPHDEDLVGLKKSGVKSVKLLEYPHYTRPEEFERKKVPDVLLSGNHAQIQKWRMRQSYLLTKKKRKDLLSS